jgi:transposase
MQRKSSKTRGYSKEFREKAVRLVQECRQSIADVAQHLGCSTESVRRWHEKSLRTLDPQTAERIELETNEIKRLKKRVVQLEQENEILKKATAYFAKEVM